MKTVGIIGHVDDGKTTLTAAIKSVLEKEKNSVYQDAIEEVFEYENPYAFLNEKPAPSKSRLKKCQKGLHEFSETNYTEKKELGTKKLCAFNHCGTFMHNR